MFRRIEDFTSMYRHNADEGLILLGQLTDQSLAYRPIPGHRSIGELAWHIVQSVPGMGNEVQLGLSAGTLARPVPDTAAEVVSNYRFATAELMDKLSQAWTDATLEQTDEMYGETWARGTTLLALYAHETHHFGQLTQLMRGAGLPVHGRFGPSKEQWALYGMEQPGI